MTLHTFRLYLSKVLWNKKHHLQTIHQKHQGCFMVFQSPLPIVTLDSSSPHHPQPTAMPQVCHWNLRQHCCSSSQRPGQPGPSYSRALCLGQWMWDRLFPGMCSLTGLLSDPMWPPVGFSYLPWRTERCIRLWWAKTGPPERRAVYPWPLAPLVPLARGGMAWENRRPRDTLFLTSSTHCSTRGWQWRWREARAACRPVASATCDTGHPGSPGHWRHAAQELGTEGRFQKSRSPHSWWRGRGRAGDGASPGWTWGLSALGGENQLGPPIDGEKGLPSIELWTPLSPRNIHSMGTIVGLQ